MDVKSISAKERKLLAAALKCGEQRLTVKALAEEAGVKSAFVHEKLKNPEFRQLFIEAIQTGITAETPAILHTFAQAAKEGSFQHGKLILELTGVHQDKQKVDISAKIEHNESLFKSDEERQAFLSATLSKLKGDN